jgi:mycothiol synthase
MGVTLRVVETDDDYDAWRRVRIAVVPYERADTVAELRRRASPTRLLLLAERDGIVVGSGSADRSESAGGGFATARVVAEHRRRGVATMLLKALAAHLHGLGLPEVRGSVDDAESLKFVERFGFAEIDRQVEQLRAVADEPDPGPPPAGIEVVTLAQQPELWAACFERFGQEALADFAVVNPMQVSAEQWNAHWAGDPMFLARAGAEVVGCAGLCRDTDRPDRAENALTAVRRDWRGRGLASYLKRRTLHWAAVNGLTELYTWTQRDNAGMRRLNERLGYRYGQQSITVARPLPL